MRRIMILITFPIAALLFSITPESDGLGITPLAYAQEGCSEATLDGGYAYLGQGYVKTGEGRRRIGLLFTPIAEAGTYTFDGTGSYVTVNTISFGGDIFPRTETGTYTVNSDCTGSVNQDDGLTFDFAIASSGSEIRFVVTTPTIIVNGSMRKQ